MRPYSCMALATLGIACTPDKSPSATDSRPADETGTETTLVEGDTYTVTRGSGSMEVRVFAGQLDLPIRSEAGGLQVSSFWGEPQPVDEDGNFLIELPADGTSLVLLSDDDGTALAQVLFPAHEDIVDNTVHIDSAHVVATAAYASSVLRAPDPRWTHLHLEYITQLPSATVAAGYVDEGIASDSAWLSAESSDWNDARSMAVEAYQNAVSAWSLEAGYGDPFVATAEFWAAPPPDVSTSGADDDEEAGKFEPQEPGAGLDGVTVTTEWDDESTVWLDLVNHEGRWVFTRLDGEFATAGVMPPTTFEVPDPVGFTVGLAFYFLDQMVESGTALYYGTEGPDSWQEFQDWVGDQVGRAEPRTFGVMLDPGDVGTLSVGGYGCADVACPTWGDDMERDWVPSLILTVLTEIAFPIMDFLELEVEGSIQEEQVAQCITDLESNLDTLRTLWAGISAYVESLQEGNLAELKSDLTNLVWTVIQSKELWSCLGVDAWWTDEGVAESIHELIEDHADELDVTGVGVGVEFTNAFISVVHGWEGLTTTSAQGAYLLMGPDAVEDCGDGIDNNGDGSTDCDDSDCTEDATCVACGDGVRNGDEECDGTDLAGEDCTTSGYDTGTLACVGCSFDTSGCVTWTAEACDDGADNDGDGDIDCDDDDCTTDMECSPACDNERDDDLDGWVDLNDPGCASAADTDEGGYGADSCNDGADDDGDGWTDVDDPECTAATGSEWPSTETDCNDGADDDGDGNADCDDGDCAAEAACGAMERAISTADATYTGEDVADYAGFAVAGAGDVDGDGYADIVVGSKENDDGPGSDGGAVYLVLGSAGPASLGLGSADAQYTGEADDDMAGYGVAGVGDVDADGYDDVLVSAPGNDDGGSSAGAVYLVLGDGTPTSSSLASADAQYTGEADGDYAWAVSGAGDVDADGFDDILIGAGANDDGGTDAGAVYLILGDSVPAGTSLSAAAAQYTGEAASDTALAVAGAGDVDADGIDDMIMGAKYNDDGGSQAGAAYLVLGSVAPPSIVLSSADAQYTGEAADDRAGNAVAGAGDVDADGYDDVLVGAYCNDDGGSYAGAVYVVQGGVAPASRSLAAADAQYWGEAAWDYAGRAVAGAGDVDADGHYDVLVGAYWNDDGDSEAGAAYLVLGAVAPASESLGAADAEWVGEDADDEAGYSVSKAGDVDRDGLDDLLIGAHLNDSGTGDEGAAYLILGSSL